MIFIFLLSLTQDADFRPPRMDVDWIFPIARKGKYWREGRRLLERSFRPGETDSHWRMIEDNTRVFLGQLLATPKAFREHIDLSVSCCCICAI